MGKKPRKFRPCMKYRYLVGLVTEEFAKGDLDEYNLHRYKVFNSTHIVDDHPIRMNPYDYVNPRKLNEDVQRLREVDRQNKELVKKINMINRKGGWTDTYNPLAYRRIDKWKSHERKMKVIDRDNKAIYKMIISAESHYNAKLLNDIWKKTIMKIEHSAKLPFIILNKMSSDQILRAQPSISEGLEKGNVERPLCFMEFQVKGGTYLGRILIELYYDHVPVTVQNFVEICRGEQGLTYKNCLVHRIVRGQYMETGDITKGTGRGGFSIYGKTFHEEGHLLRHTKAGVLSMKRVGPTDNNSQFCISFAKIEQLDHKNVVFGKVIKGNDTLFKIQDYGRRIGKPFADIIISNCGALTPKEDATTPKDDAETPKDGAATTKA